MSKLDLLITEKQKKEAYYKKEGKNILKEMFDEFFKNNPKVVGVVWKQYTPYFNDGSPCVFGIDTLYYTEDKNLLKQYRTHGECEDELEWPTSGSDLIQIEQKLNLLPELLEAVFGDGVEIIATPKKFECRECEHD